MLKEKIMKYTHYQLKNMIMQENKFRRMVQIDLYRTCVLFWLLQH